MVYDFKPNSPRIMQLVKLLTETDLTEKQIGDFMGITLGTVKVYASRAYQLHGAKHGRITLMARQNANLRLEIAAKEFHL